MLLRKSLGVCLLQGDIPISFASNSLSPAEKNYSNIESECLAVVFRLENFRQLVFEMEIIIRSDHKPLESRALIPIFFKKKMKKHFSY